MEDTKPVVLIVDDLPANRHMLARTLSTLDVGILEASSGDEALSIVAQEPQLFVALLDVRMPGMDGYTLAEALRNIPYAASLPIIFISAHGTDTYHHHRAYETGAVDFLNKPVSPRILLSKVRVFLDLFRQRSELEDVVRRLDTMNHALSMQTVRLETSAEVMRHIASILDVDRLLVEIVSLIRQRFGYDFLGIWMLKRADEGDLIALRAGQYGTRSPIREPGTVLRLDTPRSIIAHVCRAGSAYLTNDTAQDVHYLATDQLPGIRSELTLPLKYGETLFGALDIQSEDVDAFSSEDVTALMTLANQITVAIRNARLYAEVTHLNEGLEARVEERTQQLATTYRQLELLDRSKSDFITVVSHELRTPLTLINGFSQMLLQDQGILDDAHRQQEVEGIVAGAGRLHAIVDSMLDIVKIDSRTLQLHPRPICLGDILSNLATRLESALAERNLTLTVEGIGTLPRVTADPEALVKVFNELLSNAMKYTPDGGQITITAEQLTPKHDSPERYVEIVVSDTGLGIAPESIELIFTKFYRTDEVSLHSSGRTKFRGGGPGLGLTVARGIVEAHGGRIWAESPGYDEASLPGSSLHVVLPVDQPTPRLAEVTSDP